MSYSVIVSAPVSLGLGWGLGTKGLGPGLENKSLVSCVCVGLSFFHCYVTHYIILTLRTGQRGDSLL